MAIVELMFIQKCSLIHEKLSKKHLLCEYMTHFVFIFLILFT